jgi:hypothetical protein
MSEATTAPGGPVIILDALLTDGRPALEDLAGASPSGGPVTTEWRTQYRLTPGDVVRGDVCDWAVIAGISHDGITGISRAAMIRPDRSVYARTLVMDDGAEVRTDARIDPHTLWKLAKDAQQEAAADGTQREAGC